MDKAYSVISLASAIDDLPHKEGHPLHNHLGKGTNLTVTLHAMHELSEKLYTSPELYKGKCYINRPF